MIKAVAIVLTHVAVLAIGASSATAQPRAWCFNDTSSISGGPINCGFHSFEQCMAARAGGSSHCVLNPALAVRPYIDDSQTYRRRY
jgi:Protein of unknown function (DUF3551)